MDNRIKKLFTEIEQLNFNKNKLTGIFSPLKKTIYYDTEHIETISVLEQDLINIVEILNNKIIKNNILFKLNVSREDIEIVLADNGFEILINSNDEFSVKDFINLLSIIDIELSLYTIYDEYQSVIWIDRNLIKINQY